MTIRILQQWNGYSPDQIVSGLGSTEEARLIGLGFASADLDGANNGVISDAKLSIDSNGNTVLIDSTGAVLIRPMVSYSWANRPAAASNSGITIRIDDVGGLSGSLWISDGAYWKPYTNSVYLGGSAVAASNTAVTTEEALATIALPASIMGTNGIIRVTSSWTFTTSANNKTGRVRLGGISGTQMMQLVATTSVSGRFLTEFQNRGSEASQVCYTAAGSSQWGVNNNALMTGTVATNVDTTLVISGQKASAGETLTLEGYSVELIVP